MARASARRSPARTASASSSSAEATGAVSGIGRWRRRSSTSAAASGMLVPGPKMAATPASRSTSWSCGGITPPHTTRMSSPPASAQLVDQLRHERLVAGRLARHADDVDVVLDGGPGDLLGRLEQRAEVDVEAEVGEGGADHLGAAVVAVLAHLGHEQARPAALLLGEGRDLGDDRREVVVALVAGAVHAGDATDLRLVAAEHRLHGVAHLADGGPGPGGLDAEREQVAVAGGARRAARRGRRRTPPASRVGADLLEPGDLLLAHLGVVDVEHVDVLGIVGAVLVDADDDLLAAVDAGLAAGGRLLDAQLRHAGVDGLGHAAERLDLLDDRPRPVGQAPG